MTTHKARLAKVEQLALRLTLKSLDAEIRALWDSITDDELREMINNASDSTDGRAEMAKMSDDELAAFDSELRSEQTLADKLSERQFLLDFIANRRPGNG